MNITKNAPSFRAHCIKIAAESPELLLLSAATMIGTFIKLFLAKTTVGTNDITTWSRFAAYIAQNGLTWIYRDNPGWNHPPMMGYFLWGITKITQPGHDTLFPFLFRIPAILADIGSAWAVLNILNHLGFRKRAWSAAVLVALSPVLIMISGFHGGVDSLFMFFVLLAFHSAAVKRNSILAGLFLGLAINIQTVPILLLAPALFFALRGKDKLTFLSAFLSVFGLGYGYHLLIDFDHVWKNLFAYQSVAGIWGLTQFGPERFFVVLFKGILLLFSLGLSFYMGQIRFKYRRFDSLSASETNVWSSNLVWIFSLVMVCFFVFTPGFAVQYLAWAVVPTVFLGLSFAIYFQIFGSLYLFWLYSHWSGTLNWNYANSWAAFPAFPRELKNFSLLLWGGFFVSWVMQIKIIIQPWLDSRTIKTRLQKALPTFKKNPPFDAHGKKIAIFVISYNASAKIALTLQRIPKSVKDSVAEIFVIDDCSHDDTFEKAIEAGKGFDQNKITVLRNERNHGYGGNQKLGYQYAIRRGHDIVVMLHADGQYAPEVLPEILEPLVNDKADVVFGSRMAVRGEALKGGMPLYKYYGNKCLTAIENFLVGTRLSEFHSGYRAYSLAALKEIPFLKNSDSWHFDTEILLECHRFSKRIVEIPIPTYYGDEICHVNGIPYALNCIIASLKYRLSISGLMNDIRYDPAGWKKYPYVDKTKDPFSSQSQLIAWVTKTPLSGKKLLESGPGAGVMTRFFSSAGATVYVVESNPIYADFAKMHASFVIQKNIETLDMSQLPVFDLIVLADILEHLKDPGTVLHRCVNQLAPNGKVFVSLPNIGHWSVRLQLLFGRFFYRDRGVLDRSHLRFFTHKTAAHLLSAAGLKIISEKTTPIPLPLLVPSTQPSRFLWWVHFFNQLITQTWKSFFGYQWLFECEKNPGVRRLASSFHYGDLITPLPESEIKELIGRSKSIFAS